MLLKLLKHRVHISHVALWPYVFILEPFGSSQKCLVMFLIVLFLRSLARLLLVSRLHVIAPSCADLFSQLFNFPDSHSIFSMTHACLYTN